MASFRRLATSCSTMQYIFAVAVFLVGGQIFYFYVTLQGPFASTRNHILQLDVAHNVAPTTIHVVPDYLHQNFSELACVTTFDYEALSPQARDFLVFTSPPKLLPATGLPPQMKTWADGLKGVGQYVVFTNDVDTRQVCQEHDIPVMCVEHTDEGLPRLDKMFLRMERAQPDGIVAFVNADIEIRDVPTLHHFLVHQLHKRETGLTVLQPGDLFDYFQSTNRTSKHWFAAMTRWDVETVDGVEREVMHPQGGFDFWAWNVHSDGVGLLPFDVPPFRYPLAMYDNWLLYMVNQVGIRNVIDITGVTKILHREHKKQAKEGWYMALFTGRTGIYMNRRIGYTEPAYSLSGRRNMNDKTGEFPQYHWKLGTADEAPYFVQTTENSSSPFPNFELKRRVKWNDHITVSDLEEDSCRKGRNKLCSKKDLVGYKTYMHIKDVSFIPYLSESGIANSAIAMAARKQWRYRLKDQLKVHATSDRFVLMTAVNYDYRHMLLNLKCNLERVGMTDHFIVAALDDAVYEWGIYNGLPVFKANVSIRSQKEKQSSFQYGSAGFKSLTKLKSRAVLEALQQGYSVIWTDVDITWFEHPFKALAPYMHNYTGFAIQSNAPLVSNPSKEARPHESVDPVKTDSATGFQRLNSGLYVAPNSNLVKQAFAEIVAHARDTTLSEQPSFDLILCERTPSQRHDGRCTYSPTAKSTVQGQLRVDTLDRYQFPTGAVLVGEDNANIYSLGRDAFAAKINGTVFSAHNNWIKGKDAKIQRQVDRGWWFLEEDGSSCKFLN